MSEFSLVDPQRTVDEHFNADSVFWRDIYNKKGLLPHILRQRQAMALNYVDYLHLLKGAHVLEVGSGTGLMAVSLAHRGFKVNAVDHAMAMVEHTQQLVESFGLEQRVEAGVEDAHKFTFENGIFDLVVAVGVINWLHDLRRALIEIKRVLKPGGYAIFSVDTRGYIDVPRFLYQIVHSHLSKLRLLEEVKVRSIGRKFYSAKQFNQYLKEAGFLCLKNSTLGFLPLTFFGHSILSDLITFKIHLKLQNLADRGYPFFRSSGATYIVLARKSAVK